MTDDTTNKSERMRRAKGRTALIAGLIADAGFECTIVRGNIK